MLSQNKEESAPAVPVQSAMQAPAVSHEDVAAVQALMDALQASPEFAMASEFGDYLMSPQFLTSPLESPLDDFLPTPAMGVDHSFSPDILTSPMMEFEQTGYDEMNLFGDVSLFNDMAAVSSFKTPAPPMQVVSQTDLDRLITMTPGTPALDPSSLNTSPAIADASSFGVPPTPGAATARRKNAPTGTRKNVTPESLIPIDAPIQARKYVTPSVTSRKELPATFARKRARSTAFGDDEEDVPDLPLDATEEEQIKNKRLQNTLAARRSRKRKLEYQKQLEDELDVERAEKDKWRNHATLLDSLLRSHGIESPQMQ